MESSDLTPAPADDRRLEAWLNEKQPPLADEGFSSRVLAALPEKSRTAERSARWATALVAGVLGTAFAIRQGMTLDGFTAAIEQMRVAFERAASTSVRPSALIVVTIVTAISLLYAFSSTTRRRLW
jgi:hypothetical protein